MRPILTFLILLGAPMTVLAQNPCTLTPPAGIVLYSPATELHVESNHHNATYLDGTPEITDYQLAYFSEGAPLTSPPLQGPSTMPKSAFGLVSGTTNCYLTSPPAPLPPAQGVRLVMAVRTRHAAANGIPESFSTWLTSNPFGTAPAAPRPATRAVVRSTP